MFSIKSNFLRMIQFYKHNFLCLRILFCTSWLAIAVYSLKPSSENCDKLGGANAYYADDGPYYPRCKLLVNTWVMLPKEYEHFTHGMFDCPENSELIISNEIACACGSDYIPSADQKTCVFGRLDHGADCSEKPTQCNRLKGLVCGPKQTCDCMSEANWNQSLSLCMSLDLCRQRGGHDSTYDKNLRACVGLVGSRCHLEKGGRCPENSDCQLTPSIDYSEHSSLYTGTCVCANGLTASRNFKSCIPVLSLGANCTQTNDTQSDVCSPVSRLLCQNGKCVCPAGSIFLEQNNACVLQAEEICGRNNYPCGPGSTCYGYGSYSKCRCLPLYKAQTNGLCKAPFGVGCIVDHECENGLACIDGLCRCRLPLQQKYETVLGTLHKKCLSKVGSSCINNEQCTARAACIEGQCRCQQGTTPSLHGSCLLSNGSQHCDNKLCNYDEGLACIQRTCSCYDPSLTYVEGKGCLGIKGQVCGRVDQVGACETLGSTNSVSTDCKLESYRIGCKEPFRCVTADEISTCSEG